VKGIFKKEESAAENELDRGGQCSMSWYAINILLGGKYSCELVCLKHIATWGRRRGELILDL
jgi:predicted nucleic acid-binding Zn finger protein